MTNLAKLPAAQAIVGAQPANETPTGLSSGLKRRTKVLSAAPDPQREDGTLPARHPGEDERAAGGK